MKTAEEWQKIWFNDDNSLVKEIIAAAQAEAKEEGRREVVGMSESKAYVVVKRNGDRYHTYDSDVLGVFFSYREADDYADATEGYCEVEEVPVMPRIQDKQND